MLQHSDIPHAWRRADLERDSLWIQTLSAAAVDGLDSALQHARRSGKSMLAMSPGDFPLNLAAHAELAEAVQSTQRGFGLRLLRGLPVDRWTVEADSARWRRHR